MIGPQVTFTVGTIVPNCIGTPIGVLNITATSGVGPYTYTWAQSYLNPLGPYLPIGVPNGTATSVPFLPDYWYRCTVTDSVGDQADAVRRAISCQCSGPKVITTIDRQPQCGAPGSAIINVSNGLPPYSINWINYSEFLSIGTTPVNSGNIIDPFDFNTIYTYIITDSNGCAASGVKYSGQEPTCDCIINDITVAGQTPCVNDLYSQTLIITYNNEPNTGTIDVNGQSFPVTSSPQTITLNNLVADGQSVGVTVTFSSDNICNSTIDDLFTSPPQCNLGSCCQNDGTCTMVTDLVACQAISNGGGNFNPNGDCSGTLPCGPVGSCCTGNSNCDLSGCYEPAIELICNGGGFGLGDCDSREINEACRCSNIVNGGPGWNCNPVSGTCVFTLTGGGQPSEQACMNANPQCSTSNGSGACCRGTSCNVETLSSCTASPNPGSYQGNGTTCSPTNPCISSCVGMNGQFVSTVYDSNVDFAYIEGVRLVFCPLSGISALDVRWSYSFPAGTELENVFLYSNTLCDQNTILQQNQSASSFFVTSASVTNTLNSLLSSAGSTATVSFSLSGLSITDPDDQLVSATIDTRSLIIDSGNCTVTNTDSQNGTISESGCCS